MAKHKILMSNLGYFRGIDGRLIQHFIRGHRHFYCRVDVQKKAIRQLLDIIEKEDPDICCFVEVDKGSTTSAYFNQMEELITEKYPFFSIENKYGLDSKLRSSPRTKGKSNAFIAKWEFPFEKIYFDYGTKRLIYKIGLEPGLTLFFSHFSLKRNVRAQQLLQVREILAQTQGEVIFLGDFNIWSGFDELAPLFHENNLYLANTGGHFTFRLHRFQKVLDLCICSQSLKPRLDLQVIPQPFSDHAALLVEVRR
jgi:endonuclease/exonuclease/phosphatase family metal-dependent hydrolase